MWAVEEIKAAGGNVTSYACDLTDMEALDGLADKVLADHGHIDILINNAGRSIRRSLKLTYERFHDFERVMQINYFSAVAPDYESFTFDGFKKAGSRH